MIFKFTIYGKQDDIKANPIPYHRTTQGSKWLPAARRYSEWKSLVQTKFLISIVYKDRKFYEQTLLYHKKPIKLPEKERAFMEIKIYWADDNHGDPDNIFKGIADALFVDDNNLYGSFLRGYEDKPTGPKVEVTINL